MDPEAGREWTYMATTPERLDPRDVVSRTYWGQMCPNFTSCHTADAQGKSCPSCDTKLQGFVADGVICPECGGQRFYCGPDSARLPGKPDMLCFSCDAPMDS